MKAKMCGQVPAYRQRYGHYPAVVLGDPVYGTQENRRWLKARGIRFAGKPLGRPPKATEANREQLKQEKGATSGRVPAAHPH